MITPRSWDRSTVGRSALREDPLSLLRGVMRNAWFEVLLPVEREDLEFTGVRSWVVRRSTDRFRLSAGSRPVPDLS